MDIEVKAAAARLRLINDGEYILCVYPGCRVKPKSYSGKWGTWQIEAQARVWLELDRETVSDAYLELTKDGENDES